MSYNEVFGGGSISPSQRTYLSIVSAVDVTLEWPLNAVGGDNIAADIIDADMTQPGLNINFSDARQVSKGFTSLISNVGSIDFTVRDALGGAIVSPVAGTAWFIYLQDNSTEDGDWAIFQLGATMAVADAAALAGAGIKAISTTLNQRIAPELTSSTPITWTDSNRARFTIWGGGVGVLDLPDPGVVGSDWFAMVRNEGSGILTVTPPSGTIDSASTLVMNPGDSVFIITNNTDFWTIGLGGSTTVGFDYVQIDVSGSGDFNLSGVQLNRISYNFIGTLTGVRKIVVPNTIQQYWMDNSTTGAFDLEVATAAQVTPLTVVQNNRSIFYCDGTDILDADTGSLTPPVTIGQGGTSATDAATALSNLGGISTSRIVGTAADSGLGGGGDLTIDRDLVLDTDNLPVELVIDTAADTIAFYDDSISAMRKTPFDAFTFDLVPASTLSDTMLRSDGAGAWEETTDLEISSGPPRIEANVTVRCHSDIRIISTGLNDFMQISSFNEIISVAATGIIETCNWSGFDTIEFDGPSLKLVEQASVPGADEASYAQVWLRNDAYPCLILTQDDGNEVPICEEGTFSLNWSVGFSDSNSNDYRYIRIGNFVSVVQLGSNLGNSNANSCGTSDGIPVALRPDTGRWIQGSIVDNASAIVLSLMRLNTDGSIDAFAPDSANPPDYGNDWTTSGVKGPNSGLSFCYNITDA